nr:MAG TPA: hypothetical protein [Caudoviricetes sp.]
MAYNIIKYNRINDDVYVYIQKMPGIFNKRISLYFAYMYSLFDFKFRYSIIKDIDVQIYMNFRLSNETVNPRNLDILNILKSKNYEI